MNSQTVDEADVERPLTNVPCIELLDLRELGPWPVKLPSSTAAKMLARSTRPGVLFKQKLSSLPLDWTNLLPRRRDHTNRQFEDVDQIRALRLPAGSLEASASYLPIADLSAPDRHSVF